MTFADGALLRWSVKAKRMLNIITHHHEYGELIEHIDYRRLVREREYTIEPHAGVRLNGEPIGPRISVVLNALFDLDYHQYIVVQVWDHGRDDKAWRYVMLWWPHADPPELVHCWDTYCPSWGEMGAIVDRERALGTLSI